MYKYRSTRRVLGAIGAAALLLSACGSGDNASTTTAAAATETTSAPAADAAKPETVGPGGEAASPSSDVQLTDDELAQVKEKGLTAALVWHSSGAFTEAVTAGAKDAFAEMGIEVIAETDAGFDAAQQANDIETVLAKKPDIIISLVVDPASGAEAFRPAVDSGVQLVFLSNVPQGYVQGTDYVGLVTDDLAAMGITAADLLASSIGESGDIAFIYHDADYYVTNQRDQAFKAWITSNYPNISIVSEDGLADPAKAEEIGTAILTKNPDIAGIYAPWSAGPADGVLAALRAAGNTDTKLVTMDLDDNVSLDMANGGNVSGIAADKAYELGRTMAVEGAYGSIGKAAPPFVVVPAIGVTKDNLADGYQESLHVDPPADVTAALGN